MRSLMIALVLVATWAAPAAAAEEEDAARAERWTDVQRAVFGGDRRTNDGTGVIALEAPPRALDAALVPVTVTLDGPAKVKAVYLMVDGNPSPLALTIHFGPLSDPHLLKTRLRVDQYSLVHAVAETEDGRLFAAQRFVKAAGGCSAPSIKDPQQALAKLGEIRLRVEGSAGSGEPVTAQLLVNHPNNNGMQVDQLTHNFIPARYVEDVKVRYGDALVFDADTDISLSEDPAITFRFTPSGAGSLDVEVSDSTKAKFHKSFELPAPTKG